MNIKQKNLWFLLSTVLTVNKASAGGGVIYYNDWCLSLC